LNQPRFFRFTSAGVWERLKKGVSNDTATKKCFFYVQTHLRKLPHNPTRCILTPTFAGGVMGEKTLQKGPSICDRT